jgi:molybdate transport system permease protein
MFVKTHSSQPGRRPAEWPFVAMLAMVGGSYVVLIVALLAADLGYLVKNAGGPGTWRGAVAGFLSPEIVYATLLSLISCGITAILSVWVAVPLGYLLSRFRFPGKAIVDAVVDIPIVLPPLVIGLSLLIFFQTPAGQAIEYLTREQMGTLIAYVALPPAGKRIRGTVPIFAARWARPCGPAQQPRKWDCPLPRGARYAEA